MSGSNEEYEEVTLLVEFPHLRVEAFQKLLTTTPTCSVLGLDGEQPVLQLGSSTYSGEYQDATTTYVLFGEKTDKKYEVVGQTEKVLVCSRVTVEKKESTQQANNSTTPAS